MACPAFLEPALPVTALLVAAFSTLLGPALSPAGGFAGAAEGALPGTLPSPRAAATAGVATAPPSNSPPMTVAAIARRICPPVFAYRSEMSLLLRIRLG